MNKRQALIAGGAALVAIAVPVAALPLRRVVRVNVDYIDWFRSLPNVRDVRVLQASSYDAINDTHWVEVEFYEA